MMAGDGNMNAHEATYGSVSGMLKGGTLVLEKGFEAGRALDLIQRHRITMISGVPTTYQLMADHPAWADSDVTSLRTLTCGGSAVPERVLVAWEERGLSFSQGYGMTETSPGATSLAPSMTRSMPEHPSAARIRSCSASVAEKPSSSTAARARA